MEIKKRSYTVSVKGTRNFQSVSLTEGFEIEVDKDFNLFDYEAEKQLIKDKLTEETKKYLSDFVEKQRIEDDITRLG